VFDKFSGFGLRRNREWFAAQYFPNILKPGTTFTAPPNIRDRAGWWLGKQPWRLTSFPSRWRDPRTGDEIQVPKNMPYIPLTYGWRGHPGPVWSDVISTYPEIANGWAESDLLKMKTLLSGTPMILAGGLRLMPAPSEFMNVTDSIETIERQLGELEQHIAAGRAPILKSATKQLILERAGRQGAGVSPVIGTTPSDRHRCLFE
jgi:hypothetical protein